ncbi:hypothetical protein [Vibrio vulnificus]|uniref:hypothetical protein n=1 Tax=Vibrio vulnificus TaxID=672 RepID=UPI0011AEECC2|nr:hypothetical protein [Vibrio vulnificus]EKO5197473.1 hypothetical protein [Vibrio vulnificus]MCU8482455.1 hypothetical protein [Vibrio vulnificus]HAS8109421.1 hypothetical protein [Vibrio vulnificus]HAS8549848.1 hypothetical protein [Vibrio vulnificus]HDU8766923.1 hypothetical protein [Vibrio vulnificus]
MTDCELCVDRPLHLHLLRKVPFPNTAFYARHSGQRGTSVMQNPFRRVRWKFIEKTAALALVDKWIPSRA